MFGSFKTQNPIERIHIIGNSDMEQMAVAASGETTFGVINHSKAAPPDVFSLNRGHDFEPVSSNLPDGETAFGGHAAQISGRPDRKTYDTLNAQKAEQANLAAFADLDTASIPLTPALADDCGPGTSLLREGIRAQRIPSPGNAGLRVCGQERQRHRETRIQA